MVSILALLAATAAPHLVPVRWSDLDESERIEESSPDTVKKNWTVRRRGDPLNEKQRVEGVVEAIAIIKRWESQYKFNYPKKQCGAVLLEEMLREDRICVEGLYTNKKGTPAIAATAFPPHYVIDVKNSSGATEKRRNRGPARIHVMPEYLPGKDVFSYAQKVTLALILLHETYHLADVQFQRDDSIAFERAAYSWCIMEFTQMLTVDAVSGPERSAIVDYLLACVEQLRQ